MIDTTNSHYITCTFLLYFLSLGVKELTLSLLRVINVKIPLQPHKKYDITQYGELDFS